MTPACTIFFGETVLMCKTQVDSTMYLYIPGTMSVYIPGIVDPGALV